MGQSPSTPSIPAALRIDSTSDASLGVERPILVVPVKKPDKQTFFRVHPDPAMRLDVRVIELEAERETYLVTPAIAAILPGETRPVRLLTCIPRVGGGVFLWPLKLPTDDRRGERLDHIRTQGRGDRREKMGADAVQPVPSSL